MLAALEPRGKRAVPIDPKTATEGYAKIAERVPGALLGMAGGVGGLLDEAAVTMAYRAVRDQDRHHPRVSLFQLDIVQPHVCVALTEVWGVPHGASPDLDTDALGQRAAMHVARRLMETCETTSAELAMLRLFAHGDVQGEASPDYDDAGNALLAEFRKAIASRERKDEPVEAALKMRAAAQFVATWIALCVLRLLASPYVAEGAETRPLIARSYDLSEAAREAIGVWADRAADEWTKNGAPDTLGLSHAEILARTLSPNVLAFCVERLLRAAHRSAERPGDEEMGITVGRLCAALATLPRQGGLGSALLQAVENTVSLVAFRRGVFFMVSNWVASGRSKEEKDLRGLGEWIRGVFFGKLALAYESYDPRIPKPVPEKMDDPSVEPPPRPVPASSSSSSSSGSLTNTPSAPDGHGARPDGVAAVVHDLIEDADDDPLLPLTPSASFDFKRATLPTEGGGSSTPPSDAPHGTPDGATDPSPKLFSSPAATPTTAHSTPFSSPAPLPATPIEAGGEPGTPPHSSSSSSSSSSFPWPQSGQPAATPQGLETPSTPAVSPIRAPPDTDRRNGDTQKAVSTDGYADELDAIWNGIVATQNTMRVSLDKVGKSIKTVVAKAALFDFLVGNRGQGKRDVDFYNLIIGLTHRQNHMRLYEAVKRKVALSVTVLTSDIPRPDEATEKLIKKIAAAAAEEEEEEDEEDEEEENENDGYNKLLKLFDLDEVEKGIVAVDEAADLADRLHKLHGKLTAERPRTEDASPRREAETPEATTPQAPFLTPPGNFSFTAAPGATPLVVTGYATGAVSKPPPPNFGTVSSAGEERNVEAKLQAPIGNRYPHRVVHQPRGGLAAIGRRKRFYANGGDEPIVGAYGHAPQNPIVPNPVLRTNVY